MNIRIFSSILTALLVASSAIASDISFHPDASDGRTSPTRVTPRNDRSYSSIGFQLNADFESAKSIFALRNQLRNTIDAINRGKPAPMHDSAAGNYPHVTLEIFRKQGTGEPLTHEEATTKFHQLLISSAQQFNSGDLGLRLDSLQPVMILKTADNGGKIATRYIRNADQFDLVSHTDKLHSLTLALETKNAQVRSVIDYLQKNVVKTLPGLEINVQYDELLMHLTVLKIYPILPGTLEEYKNTGSRNCLSPSLKMEASQLTLLKRFFAQANQHIQGLHSVVCDSVVLNPVKSDRSKDTQPRLDPVRNDKMDKSFGCYPLSSSAKTGFLEEYNRLQKQNKPTASDFLRRHKPVYDALSSVPSEWKAKARNQLKWNAEQEARLQNNRPGRSWNGAEQQQKFDNGRQRFNDLLSANLPTDVVAKIAGQMKWNAEQAARLQKNRPGPRWNVADQQQNLENGQQRLANYLAD